MRIHNGFNDTVGAQPIGGPHRLAHLTAGDRVCAHDGCRTILSTYNSDSFCARHSFVYVGAGADKHPRSASTRPSSSAAA